VTVAGTEIPQQVLIFVGVAVGFGAWVVLLSVWRALALYLDLRSVRACLEGLDVQSYLERRSPFADSLRELVGSDVGKSPISADGVALLATEALENAADALTDRLRYLAYTPLLAGLCGTVVGLMSLLQSDPDTMQQHLAGVLFGTLSGVGATLVASSAVSWLDGRVLVGKQAVNRLLFQKLLPAIPDKKINVAIEERLLDVIETRSKALVDDIGRLLNPLAESLGEHARQSTEAANNASRTFEIAARAVQDAPVLARMVAQLSKASANAQEASARLAADAQRLATLHESESNAAKSIETASERLVGAVEILSQSVEAVRAVVAGEPPSLTAAVQSVDLDAKDLVQQVSVVARQVGNLNQELIGLSAELKTFGIGQVDALGKRLADQAQLLVEAVREQLEGTPGKTSDALQRVGSSAEILSGRIRGASASLDELEKRSVALVAFVNDQIQTIVSSAPEPDGNVGFADVGVRLPFTVERILTESTASLAESARTLNEILSLIRAEDSRRQRPGALQRAWRHVKIRHRAQE
jgi:hypothetical protein